MGDFRDDEVRNRIGSRIAARRKALKLSAFALAERSGVSRSTIANFECGRTSLGVDAYHAILEALGVEPDLLMRKTVCASCAGFPPDGFTCMECGSGSGLCGSCKGEPPDGFICRACGAGSEEDETR